MLGMPKGSWRRPWAIMILLSFAKTRSPLVSTTWEMGCNVAELGYMRPRRGILESDDTLAKDRVNVPAGASDPALLIALSPARLSVIAPKLKLGLGQTGWQPAGKQMRLESPGGPPA